MQYFAFTINCLLIRQLHQKILDISYQYSYEEKYSFCARYYVNLFNLDVTVYSKFNLEASEPKWVNPILNIIGVNSLRLVGLHLFLYIIVEYILFVFWIYFIIYFYKLVFEYLLLNWNFVLISLCKNMYIVFELAVYNL